MLVGSGSASVTEPRRGGCWWVAGDRAELEASPVPRSPPLDFILGHGEGVARHGFQGGGRQKSGEQGTPPSTLSRPHLGLSQDPGRLLPRLKRFGGPRSSVPASGHPSLKRSAAANPAAQPGDHPR